jgi:hypothetical protein
MTMSDVTEETIQQWIDGFVDDTSLFINIDQTEVDLNDAQNNMIMWKE